jgi:regulator of telomere elongation helicase 1
VLCRGNEVDRFSISHPDVNGEPLDIEDLVKLGQLSGPCPYLLSKEMASTADIVFMPYNYLIDAKNRMGLGKICWENAVLIFDEAHNLEVRSLASFSGCRCSLDTNQYAYVVVLTGLGHLCNKDSLIHDSALSEARPECSLWEAAVNGCSD